MKLNKITQSLIFKKSFFLTFSLLFAIPFLAVAQSETEKNQHVKKEEKTPIKIAKYFYKKLDGQLGDQRIEFDLMRFGSTLEGHFYFLDKEEKGTIRGTISETGRVSLEEIEGKTEEGEANVVGFFDGKFMSPTEIAGTWHSYDGEEYNTFTVKENYPEKSSSFWVVHEGRSYSGTATVDLIYVVMGDEKHKATAKKINEFINSHILNYDHPKSTKKQFGDHSEFLDDFVIRYKKASEEAQKAEGQMPMWDNHHQIILDYNNHNIVVLEFVESVFEGGVYANDKINFVNFDLGTGEQIELEELFEKDFMPQLTKVAEEVFRNKYGFKDIEDFSKEGIQFKDNKFVLNNNYALSKGGITFRFNEDEIAAHSMGSFEIFIPYSSIKSLVKKDSPLQEVMESHY
ncbi:RsiV family protein [Bernardetia sp. OM2101]|uniref:RsiV family protein n=1 Tax=Bernardetia sp. OM2101 TaxID=3344876 RepID=UPI0035CFCD2E